MHFSWAAEKINAAGLLLNTIGLSRQSQSGRKQAAGPSPYRWPSPPAFPLSITSVTPGSRAQRCKIISKNPRLRATLPSHGHRCVATPSNQSSTPWLCYMAVLSSRFITSSSRLIPFSNLDLTALYPTALPTSSSLTSHHIRHARNG